MDNGAKIRIFNLLKYLTEQHTVDLISFAEQPVAETDLAAMRGYCRDVAAVPYRPFQPTAAKALLGFLATRPRSVIDTFHPELDALVQQGMQENHYNLIIASQIDMIPYALRVSGVPRLFEEIEVTTIYEAFNRERHPLRKMRHALTWWKLQHYIRENLPHFTGYTVVSAGEKKLIQRILPEYQGCATIIPNGVDVAAQHQDFGPVAPDSLIYAGAMTYQANFDAVAYFLKEIWPLILAERPQTRFYVTGKLTGVPVEQLPKRDGVVFTGYLDDVRPRVAQSWLSVIPLRIGGGTRLKILESLALGTPVVTTSKGMEGLELKPEQDVLVADTPETFAAAVLRLLRDPELRTALSQYGRVAVQSYDWPNIGAKWCEFITQRMN